MKPLYPPFYPSEDTFPGANYVWIGADEIEAAHDVQMGQREFANYKTHVAGQMMLPTLRQAISFLLNDPVVATLGANQAEAS